MSTLRSLQRGYPFTLLGTLLMTAALGLFSYSFMVKDNLMLLLAFCGLLLPPLMRLASQLPPENDEGELFLWQHPVNLWSLKPGVLLTHPGDKSPLFFRNFISMKGRLTAGETTLFQFRINLGLSPKGGEIPLIPPAAGMLTLETNLERRDILGLSRKTYPRSRHLEIPVFPVGSSLDTLLPRFQSESENDQSPHRRPEQEKVFTREYMPGDLARDINWKSASRIGKLITRIPPESFGISPRVDVYFRSPPADRGRASLLFLETEKSLLVSFLRSLWKNDGNRSFLIFLNRREFLLESEEDLDRFLRELTMTGFSSSYTDYPLPEKGGSCCIFSSCLDGGLKKDLKEVDRNSLHLFLGQPASIENPGISLPFCQDWPRFLPSFAWTERRKPPFLSFAMGIPHYHPFYLEGLK